MPAEVSPLISVEFSHRGTTRRITAPLPPFLTADFLLRQWELVGEVAPAEGRVLVVGMGGSILPTAALAGTLSSRLHFLDTPEGGAMAELAKGSSTLVSVSRSGTTWETLTMTRWLLDEGEFASLFTVTSPGSPLAGLVEGAGGRLIPYPAEVPGRFGLLTTATLLPLRLAGLGKEEVEGAASSLATRSTFPVEVSLTSLLISMLESGRSLLAVLAYHPHLYRVARWFAQLVGESLNRQGRGIIPLVEAAPASHHTLLQALADGPTDHLALLILLDREGEREGEADRLRRQSARALSSFLSHLPQALLSAEVEGFAERLTLMVALARAVLLVAAEAGFDPFAQPAVDRFKAEFMGPGGAG